MSATIIYYCSYDGNRHWKIIEMWRENYYLYIQLLNKRKLVGMMTARFDQPSFVLLASVQNESFNLQLHAMHYTAHQPN